MKKAIDKTMRKNKFILLFNIIIFFILVIFFGFYTIIFGIGRGTTSLGLSLSIIPLLFYLTTCLFYIKSFNLKSLNNKFFKISSALNFLSLSAGIFIFLIILIFSQRIVEKALSSFIDWGSDPGIIRMGIISIVWFICWMIFILSMIIFLIGYYKQKKEK